MAFGCTECTEATFASFGTGVGPMTERGLSLHRGTPNGVSTRTFASGAMSCRPECGRAAVAAPSGRAPSTEGATHVQDDDRLPRRTQRVGLQPDHQRRGGRGAARRHRARHRRPRPHRRRGAACGTARRARPGGRGPRRRRGRVRAGDRVPHDPTARVPGRRGPLAGRDRRRPDRPLGGHGGDRNAPDRYVQIVGFPDHESAMANSKHPATSRFAEQLGELCEGEAVFHDLDVRRVQAL